MNNKGTVSNLKIIFYRHNNQLAISIKDYPRMVMYALKRLKLCQNNSWRTSWFGDLEKDFKRTPCKNEVL